MSHNIKSDPTIRLSVQNLKSEIPQIFRSIEQHQPYLGICEDKENVEMFFSKNGLKVKSSMNKRGVLTSDIKDIPKHLKNYLEMDGLSTHEISEKLDLIPGLEDGQEVKLSQKTKIKKNKIDKTAQKLNGTFMDIRVPVLMAFEFLALLIREEIYNPDFNFVRNFILLDTKSDRIQVSRCLRKGCKCYHQLYPFFHDAYTSIIIVLFGQLAFNVTFKSLKIETLDIVLLEDLRRKEILISKSVSEAQDGRYFKIK